MMGDRELGLLGIGMRAGRVVLGTARVRALLQRGTLPLVVLARDASPRTADKVVRLARARRVPILTGPDAEALGRRFGRPAIQVLAVRDQGIAQALTAAGWRTDRRTA